MATSSSPTSSPTTTLAASGTLPLSPWSSLVGDPVSVVPVQAVATLEPRRLTIAGLDVDVPVSAVGVTSDGQLEIPDETGVGWYRLGSAPGQPGAVVLAGHVSWNRTTGPFFRLHELAAGAAIDLELVDGSTRRYVAIERAQYGKLMLPAERIWTRHGPETLVLITCGGAFNPDIRRYADNIVVYAAPQP